VAGLVEGFLGEKHRAASEQQAVLVAQTPGGQLVVEVLDAQP